MEFSENDTYKTISSASEEVLYKEKNSNSYRKTGIVDGRLNGTNHDSDQGPLLTLKI